VHKQSGRFKEAEGAYHDAMTLLKQLTADFPAVQTYKSH